MNGNLLKKSFTAVGKKSSPVRQSSSFVLNLDLCLQISQALPREFNFLVLSLM